MSASPIKPEKGVVARRVKLLVASIYAIAPISLLSYNLVTGRATDSLVLLIVVVFMFASAYTLFGERTVDKATEKAEDVTGEDN